jgi:hypothetical protein
MFDFTKLIAKYGKTIVIVEETEGHYDYDNGGTWVDGQHQEVEVTAALLPIGRNELNSLNAQYGEGGRYTIEDRKLYIHQGLKIGQKLIDKSTGEDKTYTCDKEADYSDHAKGLRTYLVRRAAK